MTKTILESMNVIPDYRKGNGIRHNLAEIIIIALLTVICNGDDYAAMHQFATMHETVLHKFLELKNGIPSQDTFERVFSHLNPKTLAVHFSSWVDEIKAALLNANPGTFVGIDGKTIRGSKRSGKKAIHVVTAFASEMKLVLSETATDKKSNEITAIPELLDMFCQKGMVITIDAMGTQKDIAEKIIGKKADYVLAVKRNQEILHDDIELLCEHELLPLDKAILRKNGQYEYTEEKGHGRIETRECYISNNINWLSTASDWVGLTGFGVIISKREVKGKEPTINRHYFIFSLENTSAAEMLRIKRSHWAIENNLHWMLDTAFREDDSRATNKNAPENLNILRKQALQLMKRDNSNKSSMRLKRLRCAWDIEYAFKVICSNELGCTAG